MSLVINANNLQSVWFVVSNSVLNPYPDLLNSILIIPPSLTINNQTIASLPAVKTVNWTPVNYFSKKVVAPEFFTSTTNYDDIVLKSPSVWNTTTTFTANFRVWVDAWLFWWEVVWKSIIAWFVKAFISDWKIENTYININNFSITPKLLHTDWTLTSIWTLVVATNYQTITGDESPIIASTTTSWVVASEWDLIVADYTLDIDVKWFNPIAASIDIWYLMTADWNLRNCPLSISLE